MEMGANQLKEEKVNKLLFPLETFVDELVTINTLKFTRREIDIIACILGGKAVKKIGIFLVISPKTVENHIRNILLKMGANSQEAIIDFIEKSDQYLVMKQHYCLLLLQEAFESSLKAYNPSCRKNGLILYPTESKDIVSLVAQLEQHFKRVNVNFSIEYDKNLTVINSISTKFDAGVIDYLIYCIPDSLLKESFIIEALAKLEKIDAEHAFDSNDPDNITVLIIKKVPDKDGQNIIAYQALHLKESGNYYFFLFELLKIISPSPVLDKIFSDFKKRYEMLRGINLNGSENTGLGSDVSFLTNTDYKDLCAGNFSNSPPKKKRRWLVFSMVASITLLFLIFKSYGFLTSSSNIIVPDKKLAIHSDPLSIVSFFKEGRTFLWNIPRQDNIFVGRKTLLKTIKNEFDDIEDFKKNNIDSPLQESNVLVFTGLGGIGKTQLALHYAFHAPHYTAKIWFPANDIDELTQEYIEFAEILGLDKKDVSIKTAINYVKKWFEKNRGWLLVLDSVNNYKEIEAFLPETGGHIILTSRHRNWPTKFNVLAVDEMDEVEALELIAALSKRKIEFQETMDAKELIKVLGYLPLALAQASTYIKHNQINISQYLDLYKKHESKLLEENNSVETQSVPVAVVWKVTLDNILKQTKNTGFPDLELDILKICALLSPHKIPEHFLLTWLKTEHPNITSPELALHKYISLLWEYSIINRNEIEALSMHRLVQSTIRQQFMPQTSNQKGDQLRWYEGVLNAAHQEFNRSSNTLEEEQNQQNLLPHLQSLIYHYKTYWPDQPSEKLAHVLMDAGIVFDHNGQHDLAKEHFVSALNLYTKKHGKIHPLVATTSRHLARVNRHLEIPDDISNAKKMLEDVLALQKEFFPNDTLEINLTLVELANNYGDLGKPKVKKQLLEQALPTIEKHFGKNSPKIGDLLRNMARVNTDLGNFKEANDFFKKSLTIAENHYGKEHPHLARIVHNYANNFLELGQYELALELYERALKIKSKYYGPDHPTLAITLNAMGRIYIELSDAKKAYAYLEKALAIKERHFEKTHRQMALVYHNLGNAYRMLHELKKSEKFLKSALTTNERIYGKTDPKTAVVLCDLGRVYIDLGNLNQAKTLLMDSLSSLESFYGKEHLKVANNLYYLSQAHFGLKEMNAAYKMSKRSYDIFQQNYGEAHPYTKRSLKLMNECPIE